MIEDLVKSPAIVSLKTISNFKKMKNKKSRLKVLSLAIPILALLLFILHFGSNEAQAQTIGFIQVDTDCYVIIGDTPYDVGNSNNCILGQDYCIDNTCPAGTMEVQRLAGPE